MDKNVANEIVYYVEDAVKFIRERCDLDEETILKVLELEEGYMRSIGLMCELPE